MPAPAGLAIAPPGARATVRRACAGELLGGLQHGRAQALQRASARLAASPEAALVVV